MTLPSLTPEAMQAMVQAGMEAALPKAVQDATMEAVQLLVQAQMRDNILPQLTKSLVQQGMMPASALAGSAAETVLMKAQGRDGKPQQARNGQLAAMPKGLSYDPFTMLDQLGFRERPTMLGYYTLQEMSRKCPPVTAIHVTRAGQMAALATPQPDPYSLGFQIALRDAEMEMTPLLKKRAQEITDWMVKCGNPKVKNKRDKFVTFIKKFTWDSLSMDQAVAEIIPDRKGAPAYWRVLDGATFRISDELDEVNDDPEAVQWVQTYENTVVAEFAESELIFGVRNPRSDIRYAGYGTSELEMLIVIVTALLNAIDYNASFFQHGTVAKGILNFKGAIPNAELDAFRRQWYAMVSGIMNAWQTPVVNSDEVQWINMNQSPRDLEFSQFMDWLLKIACAIYLIAPEEIGFQFGNGGQGSTLNEGNIGEKLEYSKDKGLVPLATETAGWITDKIVQPLDERFVMKFTGINARTREAAIDLHTKEAKSVRTVDEIRKERGDPPLPDKKGEVILDPVWMQNAQGIDAAKQQGGGQGGPQLDTNGVDEPGPDQDGDGQPDDQEAAATQTGGGGPDLEQEGGQTEDTMQQSERPAVSPRKRARGLAVNQAAAMRLVKSIVVDVDL